MSEDPGFEEGYDYDQDELELDPDEFIRDHESSSVDPVGSGCMIVVAVGLVGLAGLLSL